jgi:hypothetical protein
VLVYSPSSAMVHAQENVYRVRSISVATGGRTMVAEEAASSQAGMISGVRTRMPLGRLTVARRRRERISVRMPTATERVVGVGSGDCRRGRRWRWRCGGSGGGGSGGGGAGMGRLRQCRRSGSVRCPRGAHNLHKPPWSCPVRPRYSRPWIRIPPRAFRRPPGRLN